MIICDDRAARNVLHIEGAPPKRLFLFHCTPEPAELRRLGLRGAGDGRTWIRTADVVEMLRALHASTIPFFVSADAVLPLLRLGIRVEGPRAQAVREQHAQTWARWDAWREQVHALVGATVAAALSEEDGNA